MANTQSEVDHELGRIRDMTVDCSAYIDYDLKYFAEITLDGLFSLGQLKALVKLMEGNGADG